MREAGIRPRDMGAVGSCVESNALRCRLYNVDLHWMRSQSMDVLRPQHVVLLDFVPDTSCSCIRFERTSPCRPNRCCDIDVAITDVNHRVPARSWRRLE